MGGYSAEDLARANRATRGEFEVARRVDSDDVLAWRACYDDGREVFLTDDGMSRDGWTPVVEADGPVVTEGMLRHVEERAERKRRKLLDHIASLEAIISRRNETIERMTAQAVKRDGEIEALRVARDELRTIVDGLHAEIREMAARPLTLDDLVDEWEAAEQADECREGDVLMRKLDGGYSVYRAHNNAKALASTIRILSRAPKREQWQDLADDLAEVLDADARYSEELARDLHNGGWRKGGDES